MDKRDFDALMRRADEAVAAGKAKPAAPKSTTTSPTEAAPEPRLIDRTKLATALDASLPEPDMENAMVRKAMRLRPDGSSHDRPPLPEAPLGDASGLDAPVGGMLKSVFETKDFLFGEPAAKSAFRQSVEDTVALRSEQSMVDGFTAGIGQFFGAMVGLGKVSKIAQALPWFGKGFGAIVGAAPKTAEVAKAATAGAIAFDPHEERLSNLIQDTPLANPLTEWLAADPNDSVLEGRVKAAMESVGLDVAIIGTFVGGTKIWKALRRGDSAEASRLVDEVQAEQRAAVEAAEAAPEPGMVELPPESPGLSIDDLGPATPGNLNGVPEGEALRSPIARAEYPYNLTIPKKAADKEGLIAARNKAHSAAQIERVSIAQLVTDNEAVGRNKLSNVSTEPPFVEKIGGVYHLRDGNHRVTAAMLRGDKEISVRVADMDEAYGVPKAVAAKPEGEASAAVPNGAELGGTQSPVGSVAGEAPLGDTPAGAVDQAGAAGPAPTGLPGEAPSAGPSGVALDAPPSLVASPTDAAAAADTALPKATARIRLSDEDTQSVVAGMAADAEAIEKSGGWYEAIVAGHTFGKGEGIPYAKLNAPADVDDFMARVVDVAEARLDVLRGGKVLGDEKLDRIVGQVANLFNSDPASVLGMIHQAGKEAPKMVAMMEAGYLVANRMFQDTYALASRIRLGDFTEFGSADHPGGPREAAYSELKRRLSLAASVYGSARSMTAAGGRAVRRMRMDFQVDPEAIAALDKMDGERMVQLLSETAGDPVALRKLATEPTLWERTRDFGEYLLINGMLSSPKTHFINLLSNGYMAVDFRRELTRD